MAGRLEGGADHRQAETWEERVGPHVDVSRRRLDEADFHDGTCLVSCGGAAWVMTCAAEHAPLAAGEDRG